MGLHTLGKKLISFSNIYKNQNLNISNINPGYYIIKITLNELSKNKNLIIK